MRIEVTQTFAKYIDKLVKELGIAEEAKLIYVNPIGYPGGTMFNPESEKDEMLDGTYRVIQITYPEDYYACPLIISTPMLDKMCSHINKPITIEALNEGLRNLIEI